jgi:hypothetical protein
MSGKKQRAIPNRFDAAQPAVAKSPESAISNALIQQQLIQTEQRGEADEQEWFTELVTQYAKDGSFGGCSILFNV